MDKIKREKKTSQHKNKKEEKQKLPFSSKTQQLHSIGSLIPRHTESEEALRHIRESITPKREVKQIVKKGDGGG